MVFCDRISSTNSRHAVITLLDNSVMIYLFLKVTPPFLGINFHLNVFKMDFISQV